MPHLALNNFNIVLTLAGGLITLYGLVSLLLTETFFVADAFIATLTGIIFSPFVANLIRPFEYADFSRENLDLITHHLTRIVLGVQLVLTGIQLPRKYVRREWRPLALVLGVGMTLMWLLTSLIVWAVIPDIHFVYALVIGATMTPTDPVLSASIVKGQFADKYIPEELRMLIVAESGFNDGLGFPFIYLPLLLILYANVGVARTGQELSGGDGVGKAIGLWFGETLGYVVLLSVVYGAVVGYLAKRVLKWAKRHHYMVQELFLLSAISIALFIIGSVGLIGSDDVLACFIAGNVLSWDGWFRAETDHDTVQPSIDMLLNLSVFFWFGVVCPWTSFSGNSVAPLGRLVAMSILILLLRRPPVLVLLYKFIPQIDTFKHALFVGFFGPIGVSAIFNLGLVLEFFRINRLDEEGDESGEVERGEKDGRPTFARMEEQVRVIVWFMVMSSVLVHGTSISIAILFRTVTTKHTHGTGPHPVTAELGHFATQELEHAYDKTDKIIQHVFGKRFIRAHSRSIRRRSKTSNRLLGSRSIRFHYNKSSKLNSHGTRPFPNDQEKGYGGDGGVDGSSVDGVRANGDADADAEARQDPEGPEGPEGSGPGEGEGEGEGEVEGRRSREYKNRKRRAKGMKGGRGLMAENEESARVDASKQV